MVWPELFITTLTTPNSFILPTKGGSQKQYPYMFVDYSSQVI